MRIEQQATGNHFSYQAFRRQLDKADLSDGQRAPLEQRLDTLESFMVKTQTVPVPVVKPHSKTARGKNAQKQTPPPPPKRMTTTTFATTTASVDWSPQPGQLTIVDLSCPTVDPESACQLFNVCLSLFLEPDPSAAGRVIALDEAHKYMTTSGEACALTEQLLSTIRLQRHLGARVLISTQEPTVSPKLLDLCSVTIVHRFTSPEWLWALQKHLAGVSSTSRMMAWAVGGDDNGGSSSSSSSSHSSDDSGVGGLTKELQTLTIKPQGKTEDEAARALFGQIVQLRVGEALLFAPNALLGIRAGAQPEKLGNSVLKVLVRARVTEDGGRSVMAG